MTIANVVNTEQNHNDPHKKGIDNDIALFEQLSTSSTYAMVFGGQGQNWYERLSQIVDAPVAEELETMAQQAEKILSPISDQLLAARGKVVDFAQLITAKGEAPTIWEQGNAAIGIPGVLAGFFAQLQRVKMHGFDWQKFAPHDVEGYSGGLLAIEYIRGHIPAGELFAISQIIGAAAAMIARRHNVLGSPSTATMLSIGKISLPQIEEHLARFVQQYKLQPVEAPSIAIYSNRTSVVVSGPAAQIAKFKQYLSDIAAQEAKQRKNKLRGGKIVDPAFNEILVDIPYHHCVMSDVVELAVTWAKSCGLNTKAMRKLAQSLIVSPVNWIDMIDKIDADWILDFGPSDTLTKLTKPLVAGRGIGIVSLDSNAGFGQFFKIGAAPEIPANWERFAPTLGLLPDGKVIINTAFTRLTGRSPFLLAGMTPTTVDPAIVAAAANAGNWAEIAGGGQITPEIFAGSLKKLESLLEPGRTVEFNALFLDPSLWGAQIGTKRLVQRARLAGAPIDGVVISAGIPEKSEAIEIIKDLNSVGVHYVAFKPGTLKQIKDVIAIVEELPETPILVHIEGGKAGGHHSWEDLDDLLLATYEQLREHDNLIICVGGGIGNPVVAQEYLLGTWVKKYGNYQLMPVDGILIGTAAMAAKEATTSPQVKELLVKTQGHPDWVRSGEGLNGITSSRSELGADLYEIDNSWAKCARLLDEVAGNEKAVEKRRAEIIEALSHTAKPYFGDIGDMTYAQFLERYIELAFGTQDGPMWLDKTWKTRFVDFVHRIEARFHSQDSGLFESVFLDEKLFDNAPKLIKQLQKTYPEIDRTIVSPADKQYFIHVCLRVGKPVPFVPVIDPAVRKHFRKDSLWQAHDSRYPADAVSIIPGPAAIKGIVAVNEPVAEIFERFETQIVKAIEGTPEPRLSRKDLPGNTVVDRIFDAPDLRWNGRMMVNPIHRIGSHTEWHKEGINRYIHPASGVILETVSADAAELIIPTSRSQIKVHITQPQADGVAPIVKAEDTAQAMFGLFALGETVKSEPVVTIREIYNPDLIADHTAVTSPLLPTHIQANTILRDKPAVPDAFIAVGWRATIEALTAVRTEQGELLAGELINLVHLDHQVRVVGTIPTELTEVITHAELVSIHDTEVGRVTEFAITISDLHNNPIVKLVERFAFRGLIGEEPLSDPAKAGGALAENMRDGTRKKLLQTAITAPTSMQAYAAVSGDYNPIHTSDAVAKFAGLDGVIVHGMWLSSAAARIATAQNTKAGQKAAQPLLGWTARFLGMVKPGDEVVIRVDRIGIDKSCDVIEVSARIDGILVMSATGVLQAPFTVYAFPGQGVQRKGMGLDALSRSKAAREIWERADKHTRENLGFSLMTVVRDNPQSIVIHGEEFHHPEGVLFLTQFTQVAMSTLAVAQLAELREADLFTEEDNFVTCGHSVGEYNAVAAVSGIIPLEALLTVVYHRGKTMHSLVPRDEKGRSNYQMAAIRPAQIALDDDEVFDFVEKISRDCGEFLQIVNYNQRGTQYAITGTIKGIAALEEEVTYLRAKHGGRPAFVRVPGIDVPFHSKELMAGVKDFRNLIYELIPEVDAEYVTGRYIPNLVPKPFTLDREFIQEIADLVDSEPMKQILADYDTWIKKPNALAKEICVELLAWQFASPVRWIETQDLLFTAREQGGYGAERFIEIGLAVSPTLANMAKTTLKLAMFSDRRIEVLNIERDRAILWGEDTAPEEDEELGTNEAKTSTEVKAVVAAPIPAAIATAPAVPTAAANTLRPEDIAFDGGDALVTLISSWTSMRPDQISPIDTIETITDGASSRRNQLLIDLGAELGISSIDGAADAVIPGLRKQIAGIAKNYKPLGTVISEMVTDQLRKIFGSAGKRASYVTERVTKVWQLGDGWAKHTLVALALGTREGNSVRGGDLANLGTVIAKDTATVDATIDKAVLAVAAERSIAVALPSAGGIEGGSTIDVAALREFTDQVIGEDGVLAEAARTILRKLDLLTEHDEQLSDDLDAELVELVHQELGSDWARTVSPVFSDKKVIVFDDRWASAREDLARFYLSDASQLPNITGTGEIVATQAEWWAKQSEKAGKTKHAKKYQELVKQARVTKPGSWSDEVAVVTGASKGSIAAAVVAELLAGGATVIATTSQLDDSRREFFRDLYHHNAAYAAKLWIVPANMGSYADVDELAAWIGEDRSESMSGQVIFAKPAMYPTLLFPFAAPRVLGDLGDVGPRAEQEMRVLLWGVERLIARIGAIGKDVNLDGNLHVVLPGSPNRGMFGGDGAYGEAKASLDAVVKRWKSEKVWNERITLTHAIIGWVKGTGLMGANDAVAKAAEEMGVKTYTTEQIARQLLKYASHKVRQQAKQVPVEVDLTGGLGELELDMGALIEKGTEARSAQKSIEKTTAGIAALPSPIRPYDFPRLPEWPHKVQAKPEDMIVIVGGGEVGPYGSSRTRFEVEVYDELSAAGIAELAWLTGLIYWDNGAQPGWYDAKTQSPIDEVDIADTYRDAVMANVGVRKLIDDNRIFDAGRPLHQPVFLENDISFTVSDRAAAETFRAYNPEKTIISQIPESGDWKVTRKAGSEIFITRRIEMDRGNAGQVPENFDPQAYGLSADMVKSMDRLTQWNMVATVDAFISSGFDPNELLHFLHPADIASTQGTGMGGSSSIRDMYLNVIFGEAAPNDILQESLPNVVAAHVVQSYVGSYGSMIHPVAACATAAVSLEEGVDKILTDKALFVVTGGYDDLNLEGIVGFANMSATADNFEMERRGMKPKQFSRGNDRRRAGFIEGQGGGTILLARGDIALELGLPVKAVVAYAQSFGDGVHTSIPAPGLGALAAARGRKQSRLAQNLKKLGLTPDDITVISKHDTSTLMNDVNETHLHEKLAQALGRTPGNPLFIVSQKTVTGHAKGGAAAFQTIGLMQMFEEQIIPPNRNLDCVDDRLDDSEFFVWLRDIYRVDSSTPIKAGLITSLGFGHVSGLIALVHPEAFLQALSTSQREKYIKRAAERVTAGRRRFIDAMYGGKHLYQRPTDRRLDHEHESDEETLLLLDDEFRLNDAGHFQKKKVR